MKVLKEGIETNSRNYTRFVIIAREELAEGPSRQPPGPLWCFPRPIPRAPCSRVLRILAERSINMVKLESRPIAGKPWEEMFYVDVDIPQKKGVFEKALEELTEVTATLRTLGLYSVS